VSRRVDPARRLFFPRRASAGTMSEPIEFAKLSGSGNDFVCIDNRDGRFDELLSSPERIGDFARLLCRRSMGVGADGVIFAGDSEVGDLADVAARFFEADGSEAELCGNGTACFTRWAFDSGFVTDTSLKILTPAGVVLAERGRDAYIVVCIPSPEQRLHDQEITVHGFPICFDYVVTGVPHLVMYVDDVGKIDMPHLGPAIRHHERFAPQGVNANFVQVLGEGEIAVRTWEYGVEGETLACGTGSASAAILAALRFDWPRAYRSHEKPVLVRARSGDVLRVYFRQDDDGNIDDVCLETVVRFLYRGTISEELAAAALHGPPGA
jgi:diaminopimelate epimerase